uniref:Uncharacterized protein n=1 Tax=Corvus moneduloides TaxID=1196302 RepID=A0A8C3GXI1_CORMO
MGKYSLFYQLHSKLKKNRIVGGEDARSEKWPWQASLQMGAHGHVCGASVISNRWLISAAHCFLDSDSVRYEEIILSIKRIIVHPQYDQSISDYDIALLEMETPVLFSELVQPVCLPSTSRVFLYGTVCYVTGWGAIKENSILILQFAWHFYYFLGNGKVVHWNLYGYRVVWTTAFKN